MNIEPLEARIAPASFTFMDVDGDRVVITTSVGDLNVAGVVNTTDRGVGKQLTMLDLRDAAFQGAKVSIVATRTPGLGGDGLVNVGYLNAEGRDLGAVSIDGDLGTIDAGGGAADSIMKSLTVVSFGRFGTTTGAPDNSSEIRAKLGAFKVKTDMSGHSLGAFAIGPVTVGGSMRDAAVGSEFGDLGPVKIGGNLQSSSISAFGKLASVTIGGSFLGGSSRGLIQSGADLGPVKIAGSIVGSSAVFAGSTSKTGYIECLGNLASVTVGGSVVGGTSSNSGVIFSTGAIGAIKIGGDLRGGSVDSADTLDQSGYIQGGRIGSVFIGGDVVSSNIIAGVSTPAATFGTNLDAKISGAGVKDNADNNGKGTISKIASVVIKGSAIGTIRSSDLATFGILAQQLGSVKVGGATIPLTAGASNDLHAARHRLGPTLDLGGDFDFHAFEVPLT